MADLPRVRALRLCPWCAGLKCIGAVACAACLDDQDLGDLLIASGALEHRLAHADLLSAADRAARTARRATHRVRDAAALFTGFVSDEAGRAGDGLLLCMAATAWAGCLLLLASTMGHRVMP